MVTDDYFHAVFLRDGHGIDSEWEMGSGYPLFFIDTDLSWA